MPIFFNWLGISMSALGAVLFASLNGLLTTHGAGLIAGGLLVMQDLTWRSWKFLQPRTDYEAKDEEEYFFFSPWRGGQVMLVPVWIVGLVAFLICLRVVLGKSFGL